MHGEGSSPQVVLLVVLSYHGLSQKCIERLHDVTGGVASLNFDATELKFFYGNLGSPSNPNLQYERFETYH